MIAARIRRLGVGWLCVPLLTSSGLIPRSFNSTIAQELQSPRLEHASKVLFAIDAYNTEFDSESTFPDELAIVGPHGYWPDEESVFDTKRPSPRLYMLIIPFDLAGMDSLFEGDAYVYFDLANDGTDEPLYVVAYAPARFDLGPSDDEPERTHAWQWKPGGDNARLHATHPVRAALDAGATSLEIVVYSDEPLRLSQTDGGPMLVFSGSTISRSPSDDASLIYTTEYSTATGDSCRECVDCRDGPGLCLTMRFCGPTVHCCGTTSTYTLRVFGRNDSSGDLETDFWEDDPFDSDHIYDPPWSTVGATFDKTFTRTFDVCRFEDSNRAELVGEFELHEGGDNNECNNWHNELLVTLTRGCCEDRDCRSCEICEDGACVDVVCSDPCEDCDGASGCTRIEGCCVNARNCKLCEQCSGNRCVPLECETGTRCNNEQGCEPIPGWCDDDSMCDDCQECRNHECRTFECCSNLDCDLCERCSGSRCVVVSCGDCQKCNDDHGCKDLECCRDSDCEACEYCANYTCQEYACCLNSDCANLRKCSGHTCIPSCGDGTCEGDRGEDCSVCHVDCGCSTCDQCVDGECTGNCGNDSCEPLCDENCNNCPVDCGCDIGEECFSGTCSERRCNPPCSACQECVQGACQESDHCGDRTCDPLCAEDCRTCVQDCACGQCDQCVDGECTGNCGNDSCESACRENCNNCAEDCPCLLPEVCLGGECKLGGANDLQPPSHVFASDGDFLDKVRITWDMVPEAEEYRAFRCTNSNTTSSCASRGAWQSGSSYDDTSAEAGTTYWYRVKAKNDAAESLFSHPDAGNRNGTGDTSEGNPVPGVRSDRNSMCGACGEGAGLGLIIVLVGWVSLRFIGVVPQNGSRMKIRS